MKHQPFISCLVLLLSFLCIPEVRAAGNVDPQPSVTITGNHVVVNDDDTNDNQNWDKLDPGTIDNKGLWGGKPPAKEVHGEPKLVEFTISASVSGDKKGTLIISESGSGYKKWEDQEKKKEFEFKSSYDVSSTGIEVTFWVEGTAPTASFNANSFVAVCAVEGNSSSAKICYGVTRADADVDSDNDRGVKVEFSDHDDNIEFSKNSADPGKYVVLTDGDVDNDGVPDELDGLGIDGIGGDNSVVGLQLVPMKIALEPPYSPARAQVIFEYPVSVPRVGEGIEKVVANGNTSYKIKERGIRLWTVDGAQRSNGNDVTTSGGQFIPSNKPIPWSALPSSGIIYIEYVDEPGQTSSSKEDIVYVIQEEIPSDEANKQQKGYIQIDDKKPTYLPEKTSPDAVCVTLIPSLKVDAAIVYFANDRFDLPDDSAANRYEPHDMDPGSEVIAPVEGYAFPGTRSRLTLSVQGSAADGEFRLKAESLANVAIYKNAEGGEPLPMTDMALVWPVDSFANPVTLYVGARSFTFWQQPLQVGSLVFSYQPTSASGGTSPSQDTVKVTIEPAAIDVAIVPFANDPTDLPDDLAANANEPHDMKPGSLVLAPVLINGQTTAGTRSRLTLDVVVPQVPSYGFYTLTAADLPDIVFYKNATGNEKSDLIWDESYFVDDGRLTLYVGSRNMNPDAAAQIGTLTFTYTRFPFSEDLVYSIKDTVKVTLDPLAAKVTIEGDHVVVNDDDANDNQRWDKDDSPVENKGLKGGSSHPESLDEPVLRKFSIKPRYVPGRTCTLKVTKEGAMEGEQALVKLWKDEGKVTPGPGFEFGQEIPITQYDEDGIVFWVEGFKPSETLQSLGFDAEYTVESAGVEVKDRAKIKFGVTQADIDVDSNNNAIPSYTNAVSEEDPEAMADDKQEFSPKTEFPGKIVIENGSDVDSNGVLDIFERIGLTNTGVIGNGRAADNLIPMQVSLKPPYVPATATIKLDYTASAPRLEGKDKGIALDGIPDRNGKRKYKIIKRGIRVWTKKASERTSGNDVGNEGQFVPAGEEIAWTTLFGSSAGPKTLWIEYVDLPTGKTRTKEDVVYTIKDNVSGESTKGYIQNGTDESERTYLAEKKSPDGVCVSLLPVVVVELAPLVRDEDGNEDPFSMLPNKGNPLTPFVEEYPHTNRIAHRELKVKIGEPLKGKAVTWTMEPLFRRTPGPYPFEFRGKWTTAAASHRNRFEASTAYGANGFTSLSQESGRTTVADDGFTAIRVNVPPVGFNAARIKIQIEGIESLIDLIDMEVPGVVVIDPGHGGIANEQGSNWNNATSPSGVLEKAMALDYGLALRDSLRAIRTTERLNLRIFMTRETDINRPGAFRAAKARDNGADIINIIHFNASDDHAARGTLEVYRTTNNVFPEQDTILSEGVITRMVAAMTPFDAGANHRARVPYDTAVASDGNNGNTATYCPVRTSYIEVEFIDFGAQTTDRGNDAVDILLNTGPNAAAVKTAIANAMRDGILHDLRNHQPQP